MSDRQLPEVLRCELCSKPFNKESTLKRHGYYCRSRKGAEKVVRTKSCLGCAKAKARCNGGYPSCARCIAKDVPCHFRSREAGSGQKFLLPNDESTPPSAQADIPIDANDLTFDFSALPPATDPTWDLTHLSIPAYTGPDTALQIPSMPQHQLRFFTQKPSIAGPAFSTAMMMLRILTSYPTMMRDASSPPPFIHPSFLAPESGLEALATCASLMQLTGPGSRRLVWKNVRLECERMQVQSAQLDSWQLLASMQALLVYMLVRLQEGETEWNDFDGVLLNTLWDIGCAMNLSIGNYECNSPRGMSYGVGHSSWIFEESRRRLAMTFKTIGMLFSTEPAGSCVLPDGFLLAPLPARKQLWEAPNETQWTAQKSNDVRGDAVFGVKVGGQMVKLETYGTILPDGNVRGPEEVSESESNSNWQEWCAGMDGLGALLMLAASLPA